MSEDGEDAESESDSEDSDDSSQSADKTQTQAMARLRSLSLQHRQQQLAVVPVRKAKSHIYLTRLPSVSELAAEDVARLGVPADLARYVSTSTCDGTDTTSEAKMSARLEADLPSSDLYQAEAARQEQGEGIAPELSSAREFPAEAEAADGQTRGAMLPDSSANDLDSCSDKPPRRETEQLLWEVQTLIKAQRDDQAKASDGGSSAESDDTQGSLLASVDEVGVHEAPDRDGSPKQYEDEEFSDEVEPNEGEGAEQYAENDDAFGDDSSETNEKIGEAARSLDAASTGGSASSGQIFSIAGLEDDNRRETEALLREAQALIQAQREDRNAEDNVAVTATNDSARQPSTIDQYGGDDDFDEDDAPDSEDGDPYLTDDSDEHEEERPNPDEHKNLNAEITTHDAGTSSIVTWDTSSIAAFPDVQCFIADKVSESAADHPNTDTPGYQSSNGTAGTTPGCQEDSGAVTADDQEAGHTHGGGAAHEESTAVAGTVAASSSPKRPRPPPVKPVLASNSGRRATGTTQAASRPTPPPRNINSNGRSVRSSRKSTTDSPSRQGRADSCDSNVKNQNGADACPDAAMTGVNVSKETSDSGPSSSAPNAGRASSPARSIRCSPPKQPKLMPLPDEYPALPRKDPVPKQRKAGKKPLSSELLRELKPVKSPPNLRIDAQIVDKAKRDWLFLNMFRHGDDVSKYEPFVPRSVLPRPPGNGSVVRPQSASSSPHRAATVGRGGASTPYDFGGRKLLKPQDPTMIEREKNWVATKPLDSAIPAYDSILDKYCATVTSPVIQRHIYQTRYQDLSPQLAFVLEKRAEKHFKQVIRAAGSSISSYRANPTSQ